MRIAVASDHRAYDLKEAVSRSLVDLGHQVIDFGGSGDRVDYPDVGARAARAVSTGDCSRGFLFCGSGIGMSIVANKLPGVRAALVRDEEETRLSRLHNDSNVLCMGRLHVAPKKASALSLLWLATEFEGGRHLLRVEKINALDIVLRQDRNR